MRVRKIVLAGVRALLLVSWGPFEELMQDHSGVFLLCLNHGRLNREEIRQESWIEDGKFLEIPTSHFPDRKAEFLRRKMTCPMSHSW